MKEPYLTLVGPAIWIEPKVADLPRPDPLGLGYGAAGIHRIESFLDDEVPRP